MGRSAQQGMLRLGGSCKRLRRRDNGDQVLEWEERLVDYLWREWSIYAHSASIGLSVEHSNTKSGYESLMKEFEADRDR